MTRLIAVFYPPCIKSVTTVEASCEKEPFRARGTQLREPGWQALYPASEKQKKKAAKKSGKQDPAEQPIPGFQTGERCLHQPLVETFKTSPPKRFTEASLLQLMETAGKNIEDEELKDALKDQGIGTPATRASIIETLIQRDFVERRRKNLISASKGRQLIAIVQDERLKSPELTGEWEYRLKKMERGEYDPQQFRKEVETYTREILSATSEKTVDLKNLGPCPICEAPVIRGKTGYGCSQWRQGCSFAIREDSLGANISPTLMRELLLNPSKPFFGWNQPRGKSLLGGTQAEPKKGNLNTRFSSRIIPIRTIHPLDSAPSVAAQSTKGKGAIVAGIGDKGAVSPLEGDCQEGNRYR